MRRAAGEAGGDRARAHAGAQGAGGGEHTAGAVAPAYWRDTAIALGGSLVLALLAMWLVELFNRTEPQPAVVSPAAVQRCPTEAAADALARQGAPRSLEARGPALLPAQPTLPRELSATRWRRCSRRRTTSRLVILLLLSGITLEEAIAARGDVDLARGSVRVGGAGRDVALGDALRSELVARMTPRLRTRCSAKAASPATRESIDAQILCAAHDAGLEDPASVNADCLRHTYVAYLVRQGIRFADLTRSSASCRRISSARTRRSPAGTAGCARADRDELSGSPHARSGLSSAQRSWQS